MSVKNKLSVSSGNSSLDANIEEYLEFAKGQTTATELEKLIEKREFHVIEKLFSRRVSFGKNGIKAELGPGYAAMNDLIVIQSAQGLASCLKQSSLRHNGVVIGYDNRHYSERFSKLAANAFIHKDIPVHLFSRMVPSQFVPFGVLQLHCAAGIMITGSHSNKNCNGFKIYSSKGTQIDISLEKVISESIADNLEPWPDAWNTTAVQICHLCSDPFPELYVKYFEKMGKLMYDKEMNAKCSITFTHTSLHGVAHEYVKKAFQTCGFKKFAFVMSQMDPDPNFPTTSYPNPEDDSTLDLAIETAESINSAVIIANDPDADRIVVLEQLPSSEWKIFNVNEIATLLGWWMWYRAKELKSDSQSKFCMVSSVVSSRILETIASTEGFVYRETLPGFKFIGPKVSECIRNDYNVLFAFDESLGFMCTSTVLDKDGITAAMFAAELAAYLNTKNLTFTKKLDSLYKVYGYHVSCHSCFFCNNRESTLDMFKTLRKLQDGDYPKTLGQYQVKGVRDVTNNYDSTKSDGNCVLPVVHDLQFITFFFENNCHATIRYSDKQPKIRYFAEIVTEKDSDSTLSEIKDELDNMIKLLTDEWIQPQKYNFLPKTHN